MHILERYALSCGVKIDRPYVYENFYPINFDKYITVHASNQKTAKAYDYYDEVINLIYPYLQKMNIKILQIGDKNSKSISKCHTAFDASLQQNYYIISKSLLHFGDDTISSQFASSLDKKIVFLNSVNHKQNVEPFWSLDQDCKILEPERDSKPSFALFESVKKINRISPEKIAKTILDLLEIENSINHKTHKIGTDYLNRNINVIPNCVANINVQFVISRLDLEYNQENLANQLKNTKAHIITKQPIHPDIITTFKNNILSVTYNIQSDNQPKFIEFLRNHNIQYQLITELNGEALNDLKLSYMDYGVIAEVNKPVKADFKFSNLNNLKYLSSKYFISNGKIYPSLAAVEADLPVDGFFNFNPQPIIDNEKFWNQAESFYFLTND